MSRLLLDEQPLIVLKDMAVKIGLNESIILQQIHYWNKINKRDKHNFKDGYYWTFNSYEQWREQFPFWSVKTIQRAINNLEKMKLVVSGNYNKLKIDRTKWYRINYEVLENLETFPYGQIDLTNMTKCLEHIDSLTKPLPETNTENTTETKINNKGATLSEVAPCVFLFFSLYRDTFGREHPYIKREQIERAEYIISSFLKESCLEGDLEGLKAMIIRYFNSTFSSKTDYNINHFASETILQNRVYEELY